ncbi:bifunctional tRNA (5-methylaminomethyl-2-thiouridine)(34)-methyltransferase MnmD/FAD-dependent 5-carboxymethylaminomethyl-2-thiouridine(34) oxidoreductase MnmC [Porticoccus sp.]|uniref:bifunctional tRNA (5-methylaminomethyl-2-thiouridine)(34)-methyltransferase MnmD/FAD-dependent 5-carboxymethylaminomethyl-2-thiouridine(34) oxidoreductase MnmC n=1 Tax=Porticoccus sp. TaxID=2024853 RepID=UPI003F6A1C49
MPEPAAEKLKQATISWDAEGQPRAKDFDDLYFSRTDGMAETRHVFLHHNRLPQRWTTLECPVFTIGETGFGTGLNFLTVASCWLDQGTMGTLHFVSAEKYPLSHPDLKKALSLWPALGSLATELLWQYPPAVPGIHRLSLAGGRVVLTLLYGEASDMFASLQGSDHPLFSFRGNPTVDAWFLDGFAPAKNPQLWTPELFQTIARLSRPATTFSTFTAAGIVRRGLQQVGFKVEKVAGFAEKRDMLRGRMTTSPAPETDTATAQHWQPATFNATHQPPWYLPLQSSSAGDRDSALVIGGGIAGCTTARALAKRGITVTLIERHPTLAQEGSGNPQGILYPKLSSKTSPLAQFGLMSLLYASRYHREFLDHGGNPCGVLVLPGSEKDRASFEQMAAQYPSELVRLVQGSRIAKVAGVSLNAELGLFFPQLGWVTPPDVCAALANHPLIARQTAEVARLDYQAGKWCTLDDEGNSIASAAAVVIASAQDSNRFEQTNHLPLQQIRGQISYLPETDHSRNLKTVICGEGYLAPADNGIHTLGATYHPGDTSNGVRTEDHQTNLRQLANTDPAAAALFSTLNPENITGRTAFRCTTPDYLPIAGPAPVLEDYLEHYGLLRKNARAHIPIAGSYWPGLYLNCGHGSRGMSYAPLCAELLASQICSEVAPMKRDLRQAIHPGRFIIRDMKRNKH